MGIALPLSSSCLYPTSTKTLHPSASMFGETDFHQTPREQDILDTQSDRERIPETSDTSYLNFT